MTFISMQDFLMGRTKLEDLTPEQLGNANTIVPKANELLEKFGEFRKCNSGFRSAADQMRINPKAPHSAHTQACAIDLEDADGKLKAWLKANLNVLDELNLYMEAPSSTPTWVHIQAIPPKSGHRIFIP